MNNGKSLIEPVRAFYSDTIRKHGLTPPGVDWPDDKRQQVRFAQFLPLIPRVARADISLFDLGCGYGGFLTYLREHHFDLSYTGADVSEDMIRAAINVHGNSEQCRFFVSGGPDSNYDLIVASGIFNVKLGADDRAWAGYVLDMVDRINAASRLGFGVNFLSAERSPERKMTHLHYGDPRFWLERALARYSPHVALLHDYNLWDFTLLVRKPAWFDLARASERS
jgi:SAM-dependent methyltransferase